MEASQDNCTLLEVIAPSPDLGAVVEIRLIGGADVVLVGRSTRRVVECRDWREREWGESW